MAKRGKGVKRGGRGGIGAEKIAGREDRNHATIIIAFCLGVKAERKMKEGWREMMRGNEGERGLYVLRARCY